MINLKLNRADFNELCHILGFAFSEGYNEAGELKDRFEKGVKPENQPEVVWIELHDGTEYKTQMTKTEFQEAQKGTYFMYHHEGQGIVIPTTSIKIIWIGLK